jgi:uncharacterized membrane protein YfcA
MLARFKLIRFFCGLVAVYIGIIGQLLLEANHLETTIILYVFVWFLVISSFRLFKGLRIYPYQPIQERKWSRREYTITGLSIGSTALACWLFIPTLFPILPWLRYLTGIVLLILAIVWFESVKQKKGEKNNHWTLLEIRIT